jgi:hypothetical protein
MSMSFGAQDGFALILTSEQYMNLWNKRYPDQKIEDEYDLFGLSDDIRDYSDGNCCNFYAQTPKDNPWLAKLSERMGDFGSAIDEEETAGKLDINKGSVWAMFAPRPQDYFEAPYTDLDELLEDIIESSCLFEDTFSGIDDDDKKFVRDHVAYLGVVTFG